MENKMAKILSNVLRNSGKTNFLLARCRATAVNANLQNEEFLDPELATAKSFDEIPSERAIPFLGTAWSFLPFVGKYDPKKRHEASLKQYLKFGKIVRDDFTSKLKVVHLFDPLDMEKLFRHEGRYPKRIAVETLKLYRDKKKDIFTNKGIIVEQDVKWYEIRSKVQKHMLRPATVQYYLPTMDTTAQEMVERMEFLMDSNREVPGFQDELYKWALESISLVAFDTKLGCLKNEMTEDSESMKMIRSVNSMFYLIYKLEFSGLNLWKYLPTPKWNKLLKNMDFFSNTAQKHIEQALHRLEGLPSKGRELTFLENLLQKEKMDMGHVIAMITDMFFTGIDTTSHSTAFAMYFLAKYPDTQQKVFEEIHKVLPDSSSPITVPVLNECRYLKACIKESMRLNPTLMSNLRTLEKDIVLSGYRVPAGVSIVTENLVACNMDEHFPEPLKFKPERWLRGVNEDKLHTFVFLPFGFGPRGCIGKRIAEQEMWTLLIRIIQKYRFEYHYEDIGMKSRLVQVPDRPLRFTFIQR